MWNQLKTAMFLGVLTAMVVGIGGAMAPGYLWLFSLMAIVMNVGAYFFSDKMVLAMHGARPIDPTSRPDLHAMVEELSQNAGIPAPRLYLIPDHQPNAFATGRNPAHGVVAVTEGILRLLPARELRGVIAHEIGHIKNRDILLSTIAAVLVAIIGNAANALGWIAMTGRGRDEDDRGSAVGGLVFMLVAPIAATLVQLAISRSREYLADAAGARISGDPEGLARALQRLHQGAAAIPSETAVPATASMFIVNPLHGGGVASLFSTHPAHEERIARLLAMR